MRASRTLSVPGNVVQVQDDSRAVAVALIGVPAGVGCRFSGRILGDGEEASALWSTMTCRHRRLSFFTGAWPDVSAHLVENLRMCVGSRAICQKDDAVTSSATSSWRSRILSILSSSSRV